MFWVDWLGNVVGFIEDVGFMFDMFGVGGCMCGPDCVGIVPFEGIAVCAVLG